MGGGQAFGSGGGSSSSAGPAPAAAAAAPSAEATAGEAVNPADETGECPICFEPIQAGEAAMRCNGEGGVHHYFHATCLNHWIQSCRSGRGATCPICRGSLQFNGRRLNDFLSSTSSDNLTQDDRSFLQSISDGLSGSNSWSSMNNVEKAANVAGIAAAAGWGFMLGYSGSHQAERATAELMYTCQASQQHQVAQGVGWVAGLLVRIIREATRERNDSRRK